MKQGGSFCHYLLLLIFANLLSTNIWATKYNKNETPLRSHTFPIEKKPFITPSFEAIVSIPDIAVGGASVTTSAKNLNLVRSFDKIPAFKENLSVEGDWQGLTQWKVNGNNSFTAEQRAFTLLDQVERENRFIDYLEQEALFNLPQAIKRTLGGIDYTIVFDSARFFSAYTEFNAYLVLKLPQEEKKIVFMGRNIRLSASGGLIGEGILELIDNYPIRVLGNDLVLLMKGNTMDGGGSNFTFATFDCSGFKQLTLSADLVFNPEKFVPEDPGSNSLRVPIISTFTDWNDLIIQVSLPHFHLKSFPDVSFEISEAIFDMSDTRNGTAMLFPVGYSNGLDGNLWRGLFIKSAIVWLPEELKKKGSNTRINLFAENLIIDSQGLTGIVGAANLINLDEGTESEWAMSLDAISLGFYKGKVESATLQGRIVVLGIETQEPLLYAGSILGNGNYSLSASLSSTEEINIPAWKCKATLAANSGIELKLFNKRFIPKAILFGKMTVNAPVGEGEDADLAIADIAFQALTIQTKAPYISAEYFSFGSPALQQKMAKFPIQIQNVSLRSDADGRTGVGFSVKVNFVKEDHGGLGGNSDLILWSKKVNDRWEFDGVEVGTIVISINKGEAFKFEGLVSFIKGDEIYGNGFKGALKATFGGFGGIEAMALFGNVDGFRYWYVDALISPEGGIAAGPATIVGLGGGAYYQMRQAGFGENVASTIGSTRSGIKYLPSSSISYGFKATVAFCLSGSENTFNGDLTYEMNFNSTGGINTIGFLGNGYFMTQDFSAGIDKMTAAAEKLGKMGQNVEIRSDASVFGRVDIRMDMTNKILHGEVNVFVDVAGGLMKGIGAGGKAGWAVLHFAPEEWYIHVGAPNNPVGVEFMGLFRTESYFMVGHNIPGSPAPPEGVSQILGGKDLDYMRDLNSLGNGKGFAFGSRLSINTGDLTFMFFYARFNAGVGFDLMLKDYGDSYCEGRSGQMGINGWFANGQAYAYLDGRIGMQVNLRFIKKNVNILHVGAAAVLQAKGPNPFWMHGVVGGNYNVLGGLVKGKCQFEVTLGEECKVVVQGNPLEEIAVISALSPDNGAKEVDVFSLPQAVFTIPVGEVFQLQDLEGNTISYRVKLESATLKQGSSTIQANLVWNDEKDVLALRTVDILPSSKTITFEVRVSYEERAGNNSWKTVKENGVNLIESKKSIFVTGPAPTSIPLDQIQYSYPFAQQHNFYKGESQQGYIQLFTGMPDMLAENNDWSRYVRFLPINGAAVSTPLVYNNSNKLITFSIPESLQKDQIYQVQLVSAPKIQLAKVDANIITKSRRIDLGSDSLEMEIRTKEITGLAENKDDIIMLSYFIRTSQFSTLKEKLTPSEFYPNTGSRYQISIGVHQLLMNIRTQESFDWFEIVGAEEKPLIRLEAVLEDNEWYNQKVYPLIYDRYPLLGTATISRDPNILGVPPTKAAFIRQFPEDIKLTNEMATSGNVGSTVASAFIYNLPYIMDQDLSDIKSKLANSYASGSTGHARIYNILNGNLPPIRKGNYKVKIQYVLPGTNTLGTSHIITINNPLE